MGLDKSASGYRFLSDYLPPGSRTTTRPSGVSTSRLPTIGSDRFAQHYGVNHERSTKVKA